MKNIIIILLCFISMSAFAQKSTVKKTTKAKAISTVLVNTKAVKDSIKPAIKRIIKIDLDSILAINNVEINETFKSDSSVTFATYTPSVYQSPSTNDSTTYMNISLNIQVRIEKGDIKKVIQKRVIEMDKAIEAEQTKIQDKIKQREKFSKSN